jgi:hypothetical protein
MSLTMEVLSHFNKQSVLKNGDDKLKDLLVEITEVEDSEDLHPIAYEED